MPKNKTTLQRHGQPLKQKIVSLLYTVVTVVRLLLLLLLILLLLAQVKTWFQNRRMKQKKLHRKGSSDCSVLDPVTSPLSVTGELNFGDDDDPGSDVINMAVCVPGLVSVESESAMCRAVFEQKHRRHHLYDDEDENINVDSTDTEYDADL